jgi:hypothetical protein
MPNTDNMLYTIPRRLLRFPTGTLGGMGIHACIVLCVGGGNAALQGMAASASRSGYERIFNHSHLTE